MKSYSIPEVVPTLVSDVAIDYGITKQQMAALLGVSEKTFYNLMKADHLDTQQSDRFTFIQNILNEGKYTFGDVTNFRDWLHTEQSIFEGATPISHMYSLNGAQQVLASMIRIRQGIFA
jgi:uncharacterized protein (DUF2384 family)